MKIEDVDKLIKEHEQRKVWRKLTCVPPPLPEGYVGHEEATRRIRGFINMINRNSNERKTKKTFNEKSNYG